MTKNKLQNYDLSNYFKDYDKSMVKKRELKEKFKINGEIVYEGSSFDTEKRQKQCIWFGMEGYASIVKSKKDRTFNQIRRDVAFMRLDYGSCCCNSGKSYEERCLNSYKNMRSGLTDKNKALRQYIRGKSHLFSKDSKGKYRNEHSLSELVTKYVTNATWNSFPNILKDIKIQNGCFISCDGNDQYLLLESDDDFYIIRASVS